MSSAASIGARCSSINSFNALCSSAVFSSISMPFLRYCLICSFAARFKSCLDFFRPVSSSPCPFWRISCILRWSSVVIALPSCRSASSDFSLSRSRTSCSAVEGMVCLNS
ncbi:hypothetical protein H103_05647 [Trichophyton rubrum CBS 288.86]|uniref:Uncharacterized protein n=1 Tax=Trichophyton rubrum CBS 288.86 TaxID=1215330 RepID=A0A022VYK1_TRIRU|nr:hypothetical protein H103_05647 [Trichophyton rubrum CBS 288.86]